MSSSPFYRGTAGGDTEKSVTSLHRTVYRWFPLSHILMLVWLAYIAAMIALLQLTAQRAKTSSHIPWYLDWLPGIFLTGFAQAHLPITATYLSRLGLTALQKENTQPRSWAELLWLAGGKWQGPIGMLTVGVDTHKMKQKLSSTFVLFASACITAIVTPIIISRAWPVAVVHVGVRSLQNTSTVLPDNINGINSASLMSIGEGGWATGLTADKVFSSISYVPASNPWSDTSDFFFAGAVAGEDASLTGVHIEGACTSTSPTAGVLASPPSNFDAFKQTCQSSMTTVGTTNGTDSSSLGNTLHLWWCADDVASGIDWSTAASPNATALVWVSSTGGTQNFQGYIQCNVSLGLGNATLSNSQLTFDNFTWDPSLTSIVTRTYQLHPLLSLLWDLGGLATTDDSGQRGITLRRALGFSLLGGKSFTEWSSPSISTFATELWHGTAHMAAGLALVAQGSDIPYNTTIYSPVSARVESRRFIAGGSALLAVWLVILVVCTHRMHGMTFGGSLDIYVAARLLADDPNLMRGQSYTALSENTRLNEPYHFNVDPSEYSG